MMSSERFGSVIHELGGFVDQRPVAYLVAESVI